MGNRDEVIFSLFTILTEFVLLCVIHILVRLRKLPKDPLWISTPFKKRLMLS